MNLQPWRTIYRTFTEGWNKMPAYLYEDTFEEIMEGRDVHTPHPELKSHFNCLEKAVEDPDVVKQDVDVENNKCYYAISAGDGLYKGKNMKVVLGKNICGQIEVITAYFMVGFKYGERTLWKKQ